MMNQIFNVYFSYSVWCGHRFRVSVDEYGCRPYPGEVVFQEPRPPKVVLQRDVYRANIVYRSGDFLVCPAVCPVRYAAAMLARLHH